MSQTQYADMPWHELMWAFLKSAPKRAELAQNTFFNPKNELREYRVLTLGGVRQTGKTHAARSLVVNTDGARYMGGWVIGGHGRARVVEIPDEKSLEPHDLNQFVLPDTKLLVIDPDLMGHGYDYYAKVEEVYMAHREWFHPEFSVIRLV